MQTTPHGWKVFDVRTPILTCEYSFGPGKANALAVGGEGGLFVVSPPRRAAAGVFDDLARFGPVRAIVASNAFHYLGVPEWKARFPDAGVYAPGQSIARVAKQTGLPDIRPLADAAPLCGPRLELVDLPHYKTGEVLVRIRTDRGLVWYVTDFLLNMPELPDHPIAGIVFRVMRSAPGLRFNNVASLFMLRDKAALKRWLAAQAARDPPAWLIPAHGDVVDWSADSQAARAFFASL